MERLKTAMDILDKFNFFQGQRAGRELWNDKPFEVQEEDLENFKSDINTIGSYIWEIVKELKQYRDAEEQGVLLRLPCKVGDEFFVIAYIDNKITHVRCSGYTISVDDIRKKSNFSVIWIDSVENPRDYWRLTFEEFKNQCFKTKEEAEQTLAKMKEV